MVSVADVSTVIFAPHVDDEVLCCFSFLTAGTHVVYGGIEDRPIVAVRREEAEASSKALGFTWESLKQPVLEYVASDLIGLFESIIIEHEPTTVLIPDASYNQDHRAFYDAGLIATRPHDTLPRVDRVLIYEQPHSIIWPVDQPAPTPNVFVPIDADAKVCLLYTSDAADE